MASGKSMALLLGTPMRWDPWYLFLWRWPMVMMVNMQLLVEDRLAAQLFLQIGGRGNVLCTRGHGLVDAELVAKPLDLLV
jgi:hypothetical protein